MFEGFSYSRGRLILRTSPLEGSRKSTAASTIMACMEDAP